MAYLKAKTVIGSSFGAVLACLALSTHALAQETPANIEWAGGNVRTAQLQDSQLELKDTFVFKNTGADPIAIDRVVVSCGCTAPAYTKDIIAPGDMGEVTLKYATKIPGRGRQLNTKVVFSNGATAEIRWDIQNSPNPATTPVSSSSISYPLVEWSSSDTDPVKNILVKLPVGAKVEKVTGTDKVQVSVGKFDEATGNTAIEFKKVTDQPFWGAVMLEFSDSTTPSMRVNVRSLRK